MAVTPKAEATAARISDEAARLFLENGFTETTVAKVAEAAGVATGTVLLHFGSKPELATAAFSKQISDAVNEAVASLPADRAPVQVRHIVGHMYRWYDRHQTIASALLQESLFSTGPQAHRYTRAVLATTGEFAAICRNGQAAGQLPADVNPDLMAEGLLADYLLVLLQGLRGTFATVESQVEHFDELAGLRWRTVSG